MNGFFADSNEWDIVVWGDWRKSDGSVSPYKDKEGLKEVHITGGSGMYWFMRGDFKKAIRAYKRDLGLIEEAEKVEHRQFHKGLFYFQVALCYQNLNDTRLAVKFLNKAYEEDVRSYGENAKTFLAFRLLQEYGDKQS